MFEACSYFKLSHFKSAISKTSSTCCTRNNIINGKRVFLESCSAWHITPQESTVVLLMQHYKVHFKECSLHHKLPNTVYDFLCYW